MELEVSFLPKAFYRESDYIVWQCSQFFLCNVEKTSTRYEAIHADVMHVTM